MNPDFYIKTREKDIREIKEIIKNNPKINIEKLIVKASVNSPFLKKNQSKEIINDLVLDETIDVNENGEVCLC